MYVRLGLAILLVTAWAYWHLNATPMLGDMMFPLILAPFLLYTKAHFQREVKVDARGMGTLLGVVGAIILGGFIVSKFVSEADGRAFVHSPAFVISVWLVLVGLLIFQAERQLRRHGA